MVAHPLSEMPQLLEHTIRNNRLEGATPHTAHVTGVAPMSPPQSLKEATVDTLLLAGVTEGLLVTQGTSAHLPLPGTAERL